MTATVYDLELTYISEWGPRLGGLFRCFEWDQRWRSPATSRKPLLLRDYTHITPKYGAVIYPIVDMWVARSDEFNIRYGVLTVKRRVVSRIRYLILSADVAQPEYYVVQFSSAVTAGSHLLYGYMIKAGDAVALVDEYNVGPGAAARWATRQREFA
jgi:hypothetical protein